MFTIAVDPGSASGVAAWSDGQLVHATTVKRLKTVDAWTRAQALRAAVKALGVPCSAGGRVCGATVAFVTERQYLGGGKMAATRFPSAVQVAEGAAAWETVAVLWGLDVRERIWPSTWQSTFGLAGQKRAAIKEATRALVAQHVTQESLDDNASDAILMGLHQHAIERDPEWEGAGHPITGFEWVLQARNSNRRADP